MAVTVPVGQRSASTHLPPGTMTDSERRRLLESGVRRGSLQERGVIVGLDIAIQIVLRHLDNPLPFLEDEFKRRAGP